MAAFIAVGKHDDLSKAKEEYEKLGLPYYDVSVVVLSDELTDAEVQDYIDFISANMMQNGNIRACPEKELLAVIDGLMAAETGDDVYIIKNDGVAHMKVDLSQRMLVEI